MGDLEVLRELLGHRVRASRRLRSAVDPAILDFRDEVTLRCLGLPLCTGPPSPQNAEDTYHSVDTAPPRLIACQGGRSAVHVATVAGNTACLEFLVQHGFDLEAEDHVRRKLRASTAARQLA